MDEAEAERLTGPEGQGGPDRPQATASPGPVRAARGRVGPWLVVLLALLAAASFVAVLGVTGRPVGLPVWAVAEAEARINRDLAPVLGEAAISVDEIEVMVDSDWVPRLRLQDVRLLRPGGSAMLTLPEIRVSFDPSAALSGQIRLRSLRLVGAQLTATRDEDGRFDLALGEGRGPQIEGLGDLVAAVDRVLATPALSELITIEAEALTMTLTDRRVMRTWQVGDGRLRIDNRPDQIALELGLSLAQGQGLPAQAVVQLVRARGEDRARLTATVAHVAAADLAAQAAPLGWLGVLDAPISGRIAATLERDGIAAFEGQLDIGAGALRPLVATAPIPFEKAALELSYEPQSGRLTLGALSVASGALRLSATGQGFLLGDGGARMRGVLGGQLPQAFLSQITFSQVMVDPEGLFARPVQFSQGALDLRLRLDPFQLDIGQLALVEAGQRIAAQGRIAADPEGWRVAMDFAVDEIGVDRLVTLWPVQVVPKTRIWMAENITEGQLFDLDAALRLDPGQEPRLSLDYAFRDARVRFMRTLPPIEAGYGHATILDKVYTLVLDQGTVTAPQGGAVRVDGSVMTVADITRKPADADILLKTDSSVTAALSLLDEPPFRFLTKAGRAVDLAEGRARLETRLKLPLKRQVMPPEVAYTVTGWLDDVVSETLVKGRVIRADRLRITADTEGMQISGPGRLGAVPFEITYAQPFGPAAGGRASVDGSVTLSPEVVREFRLGLPEGSVAGEGRAALRIDLARDRPPRLRLTSDLRGLTLTAPALGWRKPAAEAGQLEVEAQLGPAPVIDRLVLGGGGLQAEDGRISLTAAGGLAEASFGRVRLNGWLDAPVRLTGQGAGAPLAITLEGGQVDLALMGRSRGDNPPGASGPLVVALDRLQVTEDIALTDLRGSFTPRGGFNGDFTGRVNGAAAVQGTVVPARHGSAVRIRSDDAGAVLAAAGAFRGARGGALDLTLMPRAEAGSYDGSVTMTAFRVQDANVMAELLSAISVVGLIQQLGGAGIPFSSAEAQLLLQPGSLTLIGGAAVGASLGLSLEGRYDTRRREMALQGVVSPVYLVNGIGAFLTRRGEGLIGFNYQLDGPSSAPRVTVNPLSILTPGMFREIFRRAPPQVGESGG